MRIVANELQNQKLKKKERQRENQRLLGCCRLRRIVLQHGRPMRNVQCVKPARKLCAVQWPVKRGKVQRSVAGLGSGCWMVDKMITTLTQPT